MKMIVQVCMLICITLVIICHCSGRTKKKQNFKILRYRKCYFLCLLSPNVRLVLIYIGYPFTNPFFLCWVAVNYSAGKFK